MAVIESRRARDAVTAAILLSLIACGVYRSAVTTRLDSFELDEYYHIAAGVTYVRLGDYRVNPDTSVGQTLGGQVLFFQFIPSAFTSKLYR